MQTDNLGAKFFRPKPQTAAQPNGPKSPAQHAPKAVGTIYAARADTWTTKPQSCEPTRPDTPTEYPVWQWANRFPKETFCTTRAVLSPSGAVQTGSDEAPKNAPDRIPRAQLRCVRNPKGKCRSFAWKTSAGRNASLHDTT